jgi:endonuclease III
MAAGVRWATKKVPLLLENFQMIVDAGGPGSVKRHLDREIGCDAKIKFLRKFRGVGPKYARNMMMDVYHPDFWESIAVDTRVQKVLDALGLPFRDYNEKEKFLLEVAHEAGLNGWQLDRLLYNSNDAVLAALNEQPRM